MTAIVWFRRDLRLADHPALRGAAQEGDVLPVFVRDPALLPGRAKQVRLDESLTGLHRATDGALVVLTGDPAEVLAELASEVGARRVHVTAAATPAGRQRDAAVAESLGGRGVLLAATGTGYAVPPGTLLTMGGTAFRRFTPFARAWRDHGSPPPLPEGPIRWRFGIAGEAVRIDAEVPGGEGAARARWRTFLDHDLTRYDQERDRPDLDTTSRMSVHLALGEVHPRTLLADLATHPNGASEGARTYRSELCWREFFADVLWHHPESAWANWRTDLVDLEHDSAGPQVEAWRLGRTGFPLVDAGMRQLLAQGWMHNRVRMVVASFLVKDLHVPWQVGAAHFLDHLVDADLASNNGNWQWVAGTGVDAAPYFRVFNPVRQGLRFDPDGQYVRRWVPELAHLTGRAALEPWRHSDGYAGQYPRQILDHDQERRETLAQHDLARGGA